MKAKLTNQELFYFCEQFSILLHSGISCAEGIQLMLEDSHTQKGRDFFQSLQSRACPAGAGAAPGRGPALCKLARGYGAKRD